MGADSTRRAPSWALVAAAVGVAVWLVVDPRTPDLAAQVYRANLFGEVGWTVWDGRWYGGHEIPGYSLVFPPLAALLGVRTVGALAVLVSTALFARVARVAYGRAARWGTVWFALAALADVWSGRITFALGVSFGLGAIAALVGVGRARAGRPVAAGRAMTPLAVALAAMCAACSPVAGALLALAGVTHALVARSWRSALVLGAPAAVVIALLVGLFAEGGWEPYPLLSFIATVAVLGGFLLALPREENLLRTGALVYLAACVACVALHTPMGANVERYGVLLAGPLLLCAVLDRGRGAAGRGGAAAWRGGEGRPARAASAVAVAVAVAALAGIAVWTAWGPVRETLAVAGNASTSAAYYVPVERFVAAHGGAAVRVEVPFTRGHWEAAWLARGVSLARGWEKQLDERYNGVLLRRHLTAASYYAWLRAQAVGYVALADAPLDPSSAGEGRLIERGLPYLRAVLRTAHWRIFAVAGATPLASGPGVLSGIGHDWFALRARAAGAFVVRVHYTRYWTVVRGAACVGAAPGGWTGVTVRAAGVVRIAARFSLGRALGLSTGDCTPSRG
ncbi:MAG TPA: hypothetical protein VK756_00325 [Solirubrobacteraceae bacterium]|jgi:hypothetical protein|nr:hypothetical protein [Solirubrobacteraceae bacterium]